MRSFQIKAQISKKLKCKTSISKEQRNKHNNCKGKMML